MRFMDFTRSHIGLSPNDIMEYFNCEINEVARQCNIDWDLTKLDLNIGRNSGSDVVGCDREDKGRVYVWVEYNNTKIIEGCSFEYPILTFKNYRNSLGKPGLKLNTLTLIFDEYNKFKKGEFKNKQNKTNKKLLAPPENIKPPSFIYSSVEREKELKKYNRMLKLHEKNVFSLYLMEKKVLSVVKDYQLEIRVGKTQKDYFTAFAVYNINNDFGGIQRIFNKPFNNDGDRKLITKGFNPIGYFRLLGGDDLKVITFIYICEGLSTGLSVLKAAKKPVVICLFADNICAVVKDLRLKYPFIIITIVADNDNNKLLYGNAGVYLSCKAASLYNCSVFIPRPLKGTDANDVDVNLGIHELRSQLSDDKNYLDYHYCSNVYGIFNIYQV